MRARIDINKRMWPAWWTLGVSKGWPGNGRLISWNITVESCWSILPAWVQTGKHNGSANTFKTDSPGVKHGPTGFMYGGDPRKHIALYCDEQLPNKTSLTWWWIKMWGIISIPFKQPHYMLLNLAIGGMNGGDPSGTSSQNLKWIMWGVSKEIHATTLVRTSLLFCRLLLSHYFAVCTKAAGKFSAFWPIFTGNSKTDERSALPSVLMVTITVHSMIISCAPFENISSTGGVRDPHILRGRW